MRQITIFLALMVYAFSEASIASADIITIASHAGDGTIIPGVGVRTNLEEELVGSGGAPLTSRSNIYFFQLPTVTPFQSASVSFFVDEVVGVSGAQNVDLWGLGYQAGTTIDPNWNLNQNADAAAGVNIAFPVKLVDDFVTPSAPGVQTIETDASGDASLLTFIESLYANGATGGDFAVIRLNPDYGPSGLDRYFVRMSESGVTAPSLELVTAVPEPSSLLFLSGVFGWLTLGRQRIRR